MQFAKTAAFVVAAAGLVSAVDHTVLVGDTGLDFNPTSITAAAGDNVIFEFRGGNHTVTQSSFAQPCTFLQTANGPGVDSGFQPVAAGATSFPQWSITIDNATAPLWFYCKRIQPANHCQAGMVFAINPTAEKTFAAFQAAAKASGSGAASGSASGAASATTAAGGASTGAATVPTASGFSTTKVSSPSSTSSSTAAPGSNGALGMKVDGRAATLLAAVGLLAGLVL